MNNKPCFHPCNPIVCACLIWSQSQDLFGVVGQRQQLVGDTFGSRFDKILGSLFTEKSLVRSCLPFSYPNSGSVLHERGSRHLIKARSFSKASRKVFGGICDQEVLFVSCLNPHHMVGWSVTAAYLRRYYRGEPWPGKVKSYSYIATVPIPSAEDCDRMHAGQTPGGCGTGRS